jgi:hypothetical protein
MTEEEKDFLQRLWDILGYDTSEGAPPIHEQFYQRHKDKIENRFVIEKEPTFLELDIEEKRRRWRQYNRVRQEKLWEERKKRK